jgi:lysophospholipase L1-like esterase
MKLVKQRSDVAAVVVALAIVGGLGYALRPQQSAMAVDPTARTAIDRPQPPKEGGPTVLFIGDSYTAGNTLPELSPSCLAATKLGWMCVLSAVPGTGFISGGPANRFTVDPYIGKSTSLAERIPKLAKVYDPDVVVLDGGRNDTFPPRGDVFKAMAATIAEARRAWPTATLVLERPRYLNSPGDDLGFDDAFIAELQRQPGTEGVVVIDPISWLIGSDTSGMLAEDGKHPNQLGEQALTTAIVDSLIGHGFVGKHE